MTIKSWSYQFTRNFDRIQGSWREIIQFDDCLWELLIKSCFVFADGNAALADLADEFIAINNEVADWASIRTESLDTTAAETMKAVQHQAELEAMRKNSCVINTMTAS